MRYLAGLAAGVISLGLAAGAAAASTDPAELPPDDFAGRQYVDSTGCVYIRAEIDGQVAWVPRLNRDRQALCGFRPTFAENGTVVVGSLPVVRPDAPPLADEGAPAPIAAVAEVVPAPAPAAAAAAPAPRPARQATPARATRPAPAAQPAHVPKGYRPVWDDDRLNPMRGPRTARGDEMMNRIWTNDVPMRLR